MRTMSSLATHKIQMVSSESTPVLLFVCFFEANFTHLNNVYSFGPYTWIPTREQPPASPKPIEKEAHRAVWR